MPDIEQRLRQEFALLRQRLDVAELDPARVFAPRRRRWSIHGRLVAMVLATISVVGASTGLALALSRAAPPANPKTATAPAPPGATVAVAPTTLAPPATTPPTAPRTVQPVPSGFAPLSASFVSSTDGFVLGEAPCADSQCTTLAVTTDAGWSWRAAVAPPLPLSDFARMRFATTAVGYVFGPHHLYVTTDGARYWTAAGYPGESSGAELFDLEISSGTAIALTGQPDGTVLASRSPVGYPRWSAIPGADTQGAGPSGPLQLAVGEGFGYILSGPSLVLGPITGTWSRLPSPCPTNLEVAEQVAPISISSTTGRSSFYVACSGEGQGGQYPKAFFSSTDSGASFQPAADTEDDQRPPMGGQLQWLGVAGQTPFFISTFADTTASEFDGTIWQTVFGAGYGQPVTDFGFTNAAQGLLVLGNPNGATGPGDGLYLTRDGGGLWTLTDFSVSSLPPPCQASQLTLAEENSWSASNNTASAFVFETSGPPCSLYGYPGVTVEGPNGSPHSVATRAADSFVVQPRPEIPVVVAPGAPATFFLSDNDNPAHGATTCPLFNQIIVYPPGDTATVSSSVELTLCVPPLVSPVVAGVQTAGLG